MKYLLKSLLIFLSILIVLKTIVFMLNPGHKVEYNLGNFEITESLDTKNENNYYFEIKGEKIKINFQKKYNLGKAEKVIKKLIYKKIDGYECFLPIFKDNKILTDIMCLKENTIYNGHDLGENITKEFDKYGYDSEIYKDKANEITITNNETLYKDNIKENNYIGVETYRGLTLFNSKDSIINLFENDVYKKPISIFTGKYYVVADYNSEYSFKHFYVVNLINGEKKTIRSYDDISFDSYIMGALDDEIYLFDKDAKKQYKISIKYESVEEVANKDNLKYFDGKWKTMSLNEAINEKHFENYRANIKGYNKSDKVGDYYYLYKKEADKYKVYRADIQNKNLKTYLFETNDLNSIIYLKDTVYFRNGIDFCYYDENGIRKVIRNTELEFNDDISLGIYEK